MLDGQLEDTNEAAVLDGQLDDTIAGLDGNWRTRVAALDGVQGGGCALFKGTILDARGCVTSS